MREAGQHVDVLRKLRQRAPISVGDPLASTATDADDDPTTSSPTSTQPTTTTSRTSTTRDTSQTSITVTPDPDTSTSTSDSDTSTTSRSSSSTTSTPSSTTSTSAVVRGGSTSFVTNVVTIGQPSVSSSASAAPSSGGGGDGPSAGMVVGVVAGGLVGIVVFAGLLGYFFKTKFGKDKDDHDIDDAVFDKNDFRHNSMMLLDDDNMDRYSMRSGSAAGSLNAAGVGRNLPGLQRNNTVDPRPPSTFERHVYNAAPLNSPGYGAPPMPSFQPGQIVNTNFYNANAAPTHQYAPSDGGWGVAASYAPNPSAHLQPGNSYGGLERAPSVASNYTQQGYAALDRQPSVRPADHDYPPNGRGSPVDQQQFYAGGAVEQLQTGTGGQQGRQLSVRNVHARDSTVYEGMGF